MPGPSPVSLRVTPMSRIEGFDVTELVQHFLVSIRTTTNGKMWKKVIYSTLENKLGP